MNRTHFARKLAKQMLLYFACTLIALGAVPFFAAVMLGMRLLLPAMLLLGLCTFFVSPALRGRLLGSRSSW